MSTFLHCYISIYIRHLLIHIHFQINTYVYIFKLFPRGFCGVFVDPSGFLKKYTLFAFSGLHDARSTSFFWVGFHIGPSMCKLQSVFFFVVEGVGGLWELAHELQVSLMYE